MNINLLPQAGPMFAEISLLAATLVEFLDHIEPARTHGMHQLLAAQALVRNIGQLADFGADALGSPVTHGGIGWLLPVDAAAPKQDAASTHANTEGGTQ